MFRYLALAIALLSGAVATAAPRDTWECQLCGKWMPLARSLVGLPVKGEAFELTQTSVSLPGCAPVPYEILHFAKYDGPDYRDLPPERRPYDLVLGTLESSACAKPLQQFSSGSIIEVRHGYLSLTKELELRLFAESARDKLLELYVPPHESTGGAQLKRAENLGLPEPIASWWVIRKGYNPCDEGTSFAGVRCGQLAEYAATGNLNSALTELLRATKIGERHRLLKQHQKWLRAVGKGCKYKDEDGMNWSPQWIQAFELMCVAEEYSKRADSYQAKMECLSNGERKCP